jgi:hypothetical protein
LIQLIGYLIPLKLRHLPAKDVHILDFLISERAEKLFGKQQMEMEMETEPSETWASFQ